MKIIISPAKKMHIREDEAVSLTQPIYLQRAEEIWNTLKKMDFQELKSLWKCNEKIAGQNWVRLQEQDFHQNFTPAILAYEGIQYQYMAPVVFSEKQWKYGKKNLRILSGLYGILKPTDGVVCYRLEMQAKLKMKMDSEENRDLYAFWKDLIYKELVKEDAVILNLASTEYSKIVEPYLTEKNSFITCVFGELKENKVLVKGTQAKMARGEMVRWLAENQIEKIEEVREFQGLGYQYSTLYSTTDKLVFLKEKEVLEHEF